LIHKIKRKISHDKKMNDFDGVSVKQKIIFAFIFIFS